MADISAEIAAFKNAIYGEDVRDAMVSLANKLNTVVSIVDPLYIFLTKFNDDWYYNLYRAHFTTTGAYTSGGVIFENITFEKGHTYIFNVAIGETLSNYGYLYMKRSDDSYLNAFRIDIGTNFYTYEYNPSNTYTDIDIILGFSKSNVSGIIRLYEKKITIDDVHDLLIDENEVWS